MASTVRVYILDFLKHFEGENVMVRGYGGHLHSLLCGVPRDPQDPYLVRLLLLDKEGLPDLYNEDGERVVLICPCLIRAFKKDLGIERLSIDYSLG